MSKQLSPDHAQRIGVVLDQLHAKPGALMPILHAVQDELGFIPPPAVALIAEKLNLTRAEVHGVISFYHYFRDTPPGRHTVQICCAESCQAAGGNDLLTHVKNCLGIEHHQTSADGSVTLEPVYCLGLCACSPAMMIDGEPHGLVTNKKFDDALHALKG